jgi:uncharacterized membrane protein
MAFGQSQLGSGSLAQDELRGPTGPMALPRSGVPRKASSSVNVNSTERTASAVVGGALLLIAASRRSLDARTALAALAGGALMHRGLTGHCQVYGALGVNSAGGSAGHYLHREQRLERGAPEHANEVERSITINKSTDELYRFFRDPINLNLIMGHFAEVSLESDRVHWRLRTPLGRKLQWETQVVEDTPVSVRWESLPGAELPNEGSIRFEKAPGDWGTVVTLRFRFDPPGGRLGKAAAKLLGMVPTTLVMNALRRFKSLVETGEIPTTFFNPAARPGALAG